jgi:hypothetical protein
VEPGGGGIGHRAAIPFSFLSHSSLILISPTFFPKLSAHARNTCSAKKPERVSVRVKKQLHRVSDENSIAYMKYFLLRRPGKKLRRRVSVEKFCCIPCLLRKPHLRTVTTPGLHVEPQAARSTPGPGPNLFSLSPDALSQLECGCEKLQP